jgi:hypothetical protein
MKPLSSLRVPFGLKNGRMVSPADVDSGLACGCVCPGCESPLIARKGKRVWHFAHNGLVCANGAETALHLMAKQILADERKVELPAVEVSISATDAFGQLQTVSTILSGPRRVQYGTVKLEVARDNRRPDAVGFGGEVDIEHRIEVFVRHAVDSSKASELEALDCACFEICLTDIQGGTSVDELRKFVIASPSRIKWISYPGQVTAKQELATKLEGILEDARERKKVADIESAQFYAGLAKEEREERAAWQQGIREQKQRKQKLAKANATFKSAAESDKRAFLNAKLRLPEGPVPPLLNASVRGDRSFGVSRDIWQADVFRATIFSGNKSEISLDSVLAWLQPRYEYSPQFAGAGNVALWDYFSLLEKLGYVEHLGRQRFKVLKDGVPWLDHDIDVPLRGWFWTPAAYYCSVEDLLTANAHLQLQLTPYDLATLSRRVQARHDIEEPEAIARTVAQRIGRNPVDLLNLLAEAGAVTNIFRRTIQPDWLWCDRWPRRASILDAASALLVASPHACLLFVEVEKLSPLSNEEDPLDLALRLEGQGVPKSVTLDFLVQLGLARQLSRTGYT